MRGNWLFGLAAAALAAVVLAGGEAAAQAGTGTGTGGTSGSGTGPSGAATPAPGAPGPEMDLPLGKLPPLPKPPDGDDDPPNEDDPTFYGEDIPTEDDALWYIIDISGSMGWGQQSYTDPEGNVRRGNKLDVAKAELIKSVMALSDNFTFDIVAFDCATRKFSAARVRATAQNKQAAAGWTMGLRPQGATGTGPATAGCLRGDTECKTFILLSDGSPNCIGSAWRPIAEHLQMIRSANAQKAKIHCFGIQATGQFRQFLVDVAVGTGGLYRDAG